MFFWRKKTRAQPRTPRGYRAYAVGDVHGRLDLLETLLGAIERDLEDRPSRRTLLIFLGDLIDRGPDSKGVIERLRTFHHPRLKPYFLAGNHEEVLLRILAGERGALSSWLQFGGAECLKSYGVDPSSLDLTSERGSMAVVKRAIPQEHVRFLALA